MKKRITKTYMNFIHFIYNQELCRNFDYNMKKYQYSATAV